MTGSGSGSLAERPERPRSERSVRSQTHRRGAESGGWIGWRRWNGKEEEDIIEIKYELTLEYRCSLVSAGTAHVARHGRGGSAALGLGRPSPRGSRASRSRLPTRVSSLDLDSRVLERTTATAQSARLPECQPVCQTARASQSAVLSRAAANVLLTSPRRDRVTETAFSFSNNQTNFDRRRRGDDDRRHGEREKLKKCPLANDPDARHSRQTDMWWIVHIEGGPRRVNHAAVAVGKFIGQDGDR